ncbi:uncharacterized protein LOC116939239 isoform X3 [Petromyzon marinus]|uniref:uncharacterized protein LOC116939239 isoform X3 n=1 Tax=Petromyzon marinus TaxID=7757 RepID=UPI003F71D0A0
MPSRAVQRETVHSDAQLEPDCGAYAAPSHGLGFSHAYSGGTDLSGAVDGSSSEDEEPVGRWDARTYRGRSRYGDTRLLTSATHSGGVASRREGGSRTTDHGAQIDMGQASHDKSSMSSYLGKRNIYTDSVLMSGTLGRSSSVRERAQKFQANESLPFQFGTDYTLEHKERLGLARSQSQKIASSGSEHRATPNSFRGNRKSSPPPSSSSKDSQKSSPSLSSNRNSHNSSPPPSLNRDSRKSSPPSSNKDSRNSSSPPSSYEDSRKSSPPSSYKGSWKSPPPFSYRDSQKSSPPRSSYKDSRKSSPPQSLNRNSRNSSPPPSSNRDGRKSSPPPSSYEDSQKSSPPSSHEDSRKSSPPPSLNRDSRNSSPPPSSNRDGRNSSPPPSSYEDSRKSSPPSSYKDSWKSSPPRSSYKDSRKSSPPPSLNRTSRNSSPPPSSNRDGRNSSPPPSSYEDSRKSSPPSSYEDSRKSSPPSSNRDSQKSSPSLSSNRDSRNSSPPPFSSKDNQKSSPSLSSNRDSRNSSPPRSSYRDSQKSSPPPPPSSLKEDRKSSPPSSFRATWKPSPPLSRPSRTSSPPPSRETTKSSLLSSDHWKSSSHGALLPQPQNTLQSSGSGFQQVQSELQPNPDGDAGACQDWQITDSAQLPQEGACVGVLGERLSLREMETQKLEPPTADLSQSPRRGFKVRLAPDEGDTETRTRPPTCGTRPGDARSSIRPTPATTPIGSGYVEEARCVRPSELAIARSTSGRDASGAAQSTLGATAAHSTRAVFHGFYSERLGNGTTARGVRDVSPTFTVDSLLSSSLLCGIQGASSPSREAAVAVAEAAGDSATATAAPVPRPLTRNSSVRGSRVWGDRGADSPCRKRLEFSTALRRSASQYALRKEKEGEASDAATLRRPVSLHAMEKLSDGDSLYASGKPHARPDGPLGHGKATVGLAAPSGGTSSQDVPHGVAAASSLDGSSSDRIAAPPESASPRRGEVGTTAPSRRQPPFIVPPVTVPPVGAPPADAPPASAPPEAANSASFFRRKGGPRIIRMCRPKSWCSFLTETQMKKAKEAEEEDAEEKEEAEPVSAQPQGSVPKRCIYLDVKATRGRTDNADDTEGSDPGRSEPPDKMERPPHRAAEEDDDTEEPSDAREAEGTWALGMNMKNLDSTGTLHLNRRRAIYFRRKPAKRREQAVPAADTGDGMDGASRSDSVARSGETIFQDQRGGGGVRRWESRSSRDSWANDGVDGGRDGDVAGARDERAGKGDEVEGTAGPADGREAAFGTMKDDPPAPGEDPVHPAVTVVAQGDLGADEADGAMLTRPRSPDGCDATTASAAATTEVNGRGETPGAGSTVQLELGDIEDEEVLDKMLNEERDADIRSRIRAARRELRKKKRGCDVPDSEEEEGESEEQIQKGTARSPGSAIVPRTPEVRGKRDGPAPGTGGQGAARSPAATSGHSSSSSSSSAAATSTAGTTAADKAKAALSTSTAPTPPAPARDARCDSCAVRWEGRDGAATVQTARTPPTGQTARTQPTPPSSGPRVGSIFDREDSSPVAHAGIRSREATPRGLPGSHGSRGSQAPSRRAIVERLERQSGGQQKTASPVKLQRAGSFGATTIKQMLLEWCRAKTRGYEHVDIQNFSTSWSDGLAFCALIHHFFPEAFDFSELEPRNRRHNFDLAFTTAEKQVGCPQLLDTEDMVLLREPDWKCVYTYVQELYRSLVEKGLVKTKSRS